MRKFIYYFCWVVVVAVLLAPLLHLVTIPDLHHYLSLFKNQKGVVTAITNTFLVSLSVGVMCVLIGVPLAWLLTRTDLPTKNKLRSWFCLPYAVPPFVGAIGWIILANPSSGLLNKLLGLNLNIYSFTGLVWVETSFLFTFVLLTTLTALDRMDSSLEEAARLSGASGLRVFTDISLPLLKPAIFNGFVLSFLATAASFGVPAMIGGPARIYLMTTQIYTFQRMGTISGLERAIAISVLLMFATLLLLFFAQITLGKTQSHLVGGKTTRPSVIQLRGFQKPILGALYSLLFVIFILPMLGILLSALSRVQGEWSLKNLGLQNFNRVLFQTDETLRALSQSFILGLSAAVICITLSFFISYYTVRTKWRGHKMIGILASIPFSTPGTVLALSLIFSFSQGYFGYGPSLYNTLGLILLAYVIKYLSLSLKTLQDGYSQIHPSLEEAAWISGASWWATMRTIFLPLLKPSLIAAGFFIFMPVMSELTMTVLLTGPGLETVGTLIFQLQEYSDVGGGGAAVLSVLVVSTIFLLNYVLKKISKGAFGL